MFRCHERCFYCHYTDCYNRRYGPDVLDWIISIEKLAGVYLPEDALIYEEERLEAASVEQRQLREEKRKKEIKKYFFPPKPVLFYRRK